MITDVGLSGTRETTSEHTEIAFDPVMVAFRHPDHFLRLAYLE
jgi:hypothetical protein